jgi:hypothetical protein
MSLTNLRYRTADSESLKSLKKIIFLSELSATTNSNHLLLLAALTNIKHLLRDK